MVKMRVTYQGDKHCELQHLPSGSVIATDAPTDNGGRGEKFSPTDLLGAALGSCILTTMAIFAEKEGRSIDLEGSTAEVVKEMNSQPRRVGALHVKLSLPAHVAEADRRLLQTVADACPVSRSLHPDLKLQVTLSYDL